MLRPSRRLFVVRSFPFTMMPHPRSAGISRLITIDLAVVVVVKPMEEPLNAALAHSFSPARVRISLRTTLSHFTWRRRRIRSARRRRRSFKCTASMTTMSPFRLRSRTLPLHASSTTITVIPIHGAIRATVGPLAHHILNALAHPLPNPLAHLSHPRRIL